MTPQELKKAFKNLKAMETALGFSRNCYQVWKSKGAIPIEKQCYIEMATKGKLKADRNLMPKIKNETLLTGGVNA